MTDLSKLTDEELLSLLESNYESLKEENKRLKDSLKTSQDLAQNSIEQYNEKLGQCDKFREALENIKLHQQMTGGEQYAKVGAWVIADKALGEE